MYLKKIAMVIALVAISQFAVADDFSGQWRVRGSPTIWEVHDNNGSLSGTSHAEDGDYSLSGTHINQQKASVTIYRTDLSGCLLSMQQTWTLIGNPYYIRVFVNGNTGGCGHSANDLAKAVLMMDRE